MKNCPWFSLRSNSIESRFRSIRRGNFLVNIFVTLEKSKSKIKSNSEFASLIKLFFSLRSIQAQFSACDLRLFRLHSLKSCFSRSLGANFGASLVDTRSINAFQRLKMAFFSPITKLRDEMMVFVMGWLKSQMRAKQTLTSFRYFAVTEGAISHYRRVHVVYRIEMSRQILMSSSQYVVFYIKNGKNSQYACSHQFF